MNKQHDIHSAAKACRNFLVLVLVLRICSYFMLSESAAVTQAIKAGLRVSLTGILFFTLLWQLRIPGSNKVKFVQPFPLVTYISYLLFGAASLLWTSSLQSSLEQWLMDAEGFIFACLYMALFSVWVRRYGTDILNISSVISASVLITGAGFLAGLYLDTDRFYRLTHGGAVSRLGGFIINPNELGMLLVFGIAAFLHILVKDGKYRLSVLLSIALLVHLLILTGSRSSFIALVLVLVTYAAFFGTRLQRNLVILSALAMFPLAGWSFFVKEGQTTELFTMTGRIPFWQDLLTFNFAKAPWFGYGYMRIDYADKFESLNSYAGAMTHNTFLQVLLGLGIIGLAIVMLQLFSFFYSLRRVADSSLRRKIFMLFIPLFVNSMTEFGIFGETNYGILFYLMLLFSVASEPAGQSGRIRPKPHHETSGGIPYRSFAAS